MADCDFWRKAADAGFMGFEIESAARGAGLVLQNDIVVPYMSDLASKEQAEEWLLRVARGDLLLALAVAEPHSESDLRAMATSARPHADGDHYVITGDKIRQLWHPGRSADRRGPDV